MLSRFAFERLVSAAIFALAATAVVACGDDKKSAAQADATAPFQVTGRVVDEAGQALVAARVTVFGGASATTDAQGAYSLMAQSNNGLTVPLSFTASGHATVRRALPPATASLALPDTTLRAVDQAQTVTLPAAGQAAAIVSVQKADGAVQLTIPAGSLVGPDGSPASGTATVSLTYWHPQQLGSTLPGLLTAVGASGDSMRLISYGMADIEVKQNGAELQVAPGANVALAFTASALQRQTLASMNTADLPQLLWLDPSVSQWRGVYKVGDGNAYTYDTAAGLFTAQLPHLSAWNVDGVVDFDSGGCVTGAVIDSCTGQPLARQTVNLWPLSFEGLFNYTAVTNAAGRWCITMGMASREAQTFQYFLSGAGMADSTLCNPLPSKCRTPDPIVQAYANQHAYNTCKNLPDGIRCGDEASCRAVFPDTRDFYGNDNACSPASPTTTLQACSFCSGDRYRPQTCSLGSPVTSTCQELVKLVLPGPGCNCVDPGGACSAGKSCCVGGDGSPSACSGTGRCVPCSQGRRQGDTCSLTDVCCDPSKPYPPLTCSDGFCVSALEPDKDQ